MPLNYVNNLKAKIKRLEYWATFNLSHTFVLNGTSSVRGHDDNNMRVAMTNAMITGTQ